jgi:hypothetical protein
MLLATPPTRSRARLKETLWDIGDIVKLVEKWERAQTASPE